MNDIAIIPARSGSKGLKDKNIKLMHGKPLLSYTIEAARQSGLFSKIFVSTDSEEYACIACECGAEVPFLRSEALSGDRASSWDTVEEALRMWEEGGEHFDRFALLQPTSPLRTADDLLGADAVYRAKNALAVVSVCEAEHTMALYNTIPSDGSMTGFLRKTDSKPRQLAEKFYRLNGAIYLSSVAHFRATELIYDSDCYAYVMDNTHSIDIDSQLDFDMVSFLMEKLGMVKE